LLLGFGIGIAIGSAQLLGAPTVAVILFFGVFLVHNTRRPVVVTAVSDVADDPALATVLSVESQAQSAFAALFALVLGALIDLFTGDIGPAIAIVSVVGLLVGLLVRLNRDGAPSPSQ
jgi:hypothetical protein